MSLLIKTLQTTTDGPITLGDVVAALGDTDPDKTNAKALQIRIGRGSLSTVQKHLEALRAAKREKAEPPPITALPAPADTMAALWVAACNAAQVPTLSRLERLSAERDALVAQVEAQAQDATVLAAEVDTLTQQVASEAQTRQAESEKQAAELLKGQAELEAAKTEVSQLKDQISKVTLAAKNAADATEKDRQLERQTLQSTITNLVDQISYLKSLHMMSVASNKEAADKEASEKASQ
jgi:hypothetical protein